MLNRTSGVLKDEARQLHGMCLNGGADLQNAITVLCALVEEVADNLESAERKVVLLEQKISRS